ncbi:hypothetical protein TNCV_229941 [Trichonephila clavipes]|nr:hypothetical protein TNCV_229941 [Trichonephila clavipes]
MLAIRLQVLPRPESTETKSVDWKRVAWSYESRVRLNVNGRLRIWRQAHEAMDPACQIFWVITSIPLCCSVIRTEMEFSCKTTVPPTRPGWLLADWMGFLWLFCRKLAI